MNILDKFNKSFNNLHIFENNKLSKLYPKIKFSNIPDSWINIIEKMLIKFDKKKLKQYIKEIYQVNGQLMVPILLTDASMSYFKIFKEASKLIDNLPEMKKLYYLYDKSDIFTRINDKAREEFKNNADEKTNKTIPL